MSLSATLQRASTGLDTAPDAARMRADERFTGLVAQFCALAQLGDATSVRAGTGFSIDGTGFCFRRDENRNPQTFCVWCDVGFIPAGEPTDRYRLLLEANLRHDGVFASTMALCPDSGWIVCSARAPLDRLGAGMLLDYLKSLARDAFDWRSGILDTIPALPAAPANAAETALAPPRAFLGWLRAFCPFAGLDARAVEGILLGAPVVVDEVGFFFRHGDHPDRRIASLYCDYGGIGDIGDHLALFRTLLLTNMFLHPASGQNLLISPRTERILLRQDFVVKTMAPAAMQDLLRAYAQKVLDWRAAQEG